MVRWGFAPSWQHVRGLALEAASRDEFRAELLRQLVDWIGGDGGFLQQVAPTHAAPAEGTFHRQDMGLIDRCHRDWDTHYAPELHPLLSAVTRSAALVVDTHVLDTRARSRLAFYCDVMAPQRVQEAACGLVDVGDGRMLSICIMRRSTGAAPFEANPLAHVRNLLPVIGTSDAMLSVRQHRGSPLPLGNELTRRERDIVDLVALGYTNGEIGAALGTSKLTVRNQLASVFRKLDVTTRAELVGLLVRRHSEDSAREQSFR